LWPGDANGQARGRGIGTAVSRAALDRLRQAGVATVLLTATDLGRPIYERLGFGYDGLHYGIWRREPEADAGGRSDGTADGVVRAGEIGDLAGPDVGATGEDRRGYLTPFAARVRVTGDGTGYRVALPWGSGPVIASGADSARALLADLVRAEAEPFLAFPEANAAGAEVAVSLGFRQIKNIPRMRFGPPVPGFRPERVFNVFSFAVG
jgi:Acetyltransferase (GNAT) domain